MDEYLKFLESKKKSISESGFDVDESELNTHLFDFQKWIVKKALKMGRYAVFADCGLGKGQPYGSNVLTPTGWTEIQNLKTGDDIIGGNGKIQRVTGVYPKSEIKTYRFHYSDGVSCVFDEDHLHICRTNNDRQRDGEWRVLSTKDLLNSKIRYGKDGKSRNYDIPVVEPIKFKPKQLSVKPYLLGVLLGDGCLRSVVGFSSKDEEIIDVVCSEAGNNYNIKKCTGKYDYRISYIKNQANPLKKALIKLGLWGKLSYNKFIPKPYLFSSIEDRLSLLRGLMDTDGYIKDTCQFYSSSKQLAEDVMFLIRSLGGAPTLSQKIPSYTHNNENRSGAIHYTVTFSLKNFNPFAIARKAKLWNPIPRDNGRWIDRIEFESVQKTVCISVDTPNKSYVTEHFIVTHNTLMQLEWANQVAKHTNRNVLILAPLAVSGQTIQEAEKFGLGSEIGKYGHGNNIQIINYDQLENIDTSNFCGVVLDESSILKNYEGKIKSIILSRFADTPYKLACTATPSPNDPMELGNHAEFLNVMSRNEMLAMYFVHDGGQTSKWRLKGHCQQAYWNWVSHWAVMLSNPSDIGFSSDGYDLPQLNLIEEQIKTSKRENGRLFNDVSVSATDFNQELRLTKIDRVSRVAEIINNSDENFIIWVKQNEEADYLKKLIPDAIEVRGNDRPEDKESKLLGFGRNEFRVLLTKTKIAMFGMNYQNCHNQIFASLDFSFEGLYQAIRRSYRFGQSHTVNIYLITSDTMQNVIESIWRKQEQFNEMQQAMQKAINKNLNHINKIKMQREFQEYKTDDCLLQLGDCVQLIKKVEDDSTGFSIFSPPFAELYTYSDELEDMGNSKNYHEFLFAFNFLVQELFRVIWSGRNVAVHCMDLPIQKGKEGFIGLRDFSNMIRESFENAGFIYHTRITIWKNPVTEMQRTKALGLLHKQVKKDAAMSRVGIPDNLLVFRKPGEHTHPVRCNIPVDLWQKYASPVWMDIDYSNTLNGRDGRDEKDEKHICPLQLDTIERAIHLWTNEGDTILTPFAGIGSECYQALSMNRKAIGFELKQTYFDVAVKNCQAAVAEKLQLSLFA